MDFDLRSFLERVDRSRRDSRRPRMTDAEVRETLEKVAQRIWETNPNLKKVDDVQTEAERLEDMSEVVASKPALLQDLAKELRGEYEGKLKEINDLLADAKVKRGLSDIRTIRSALEELG